MANFFDQFDAPSKQTGGNFFDQFDAPSEAKKPEGGLVASLKQTGGQMVKSAGQLAADVLPGVDRENALTRTGQGIIDANPTAVRSLSDVADSPWTATKEAVGNAAASIGGVVGARLLGQGITAAAPLAGPAAPLVAGIGQGISWLGPTAMAALPSYGGIREQQIAADPNNEGSLASKALAGAGAATVGLIENRFGPQEWALKALSQGGRDALAKQFAANSLAGAIGKGAVKGAAIEGAEELVQNPIEQLASYQDPRTAENLQDTAFGGVMGALGGGVLGGGAGGLSRTITPSQAQQPAQPQQPAIDPNAGPLSKAASMATQTPELSPLAFTPMEPTDPELETDAQTQERLRAAQFQADAMPFEPSISFEQGPQPVRATNQDGIPFERISPEDYDTLNPIRAGEGELLDSERPTAGRTRAPDAIKGQAQRRIGVADDGTQDQSGPMRTLGERVQPAQGENASTRALPYFTDQKAEQSARKALPFANEPAAQKKAAELSKKRNEPFSVIPHPALADRFAVVPFRNLRTPNEQGQAPQLAARMQAGQQEEVVRVGENVQQSATDGLAATATATSVQTQPATESVTNGLPPAQKLAQEAEAAQGAQGAASRQKFVSLAAYNITTPDPVKAGDTALSKEDAVFELDVLQDRADRGRLTPEAFAQSGIAQRLDTSQMMTINDSIRAGDFSFIGAIKSRIEQAAQAQQPNQTPAARGQEGAAAEQQAAPAVAGAADNEVVRALRHSKEFIARFKDSPSELKKQQRFTAEAEKKFGISKIAGYRGGLTVHVADRNDGNATVYMQGPSGNFLEAGTIPLSQTAVYGRIEQAAPNQRSESAQPDISPDTITPNPAPAKAKAADTQFDVSTRTDDQLRYLTVSGKPGWKEAAQSELARRQGTPQPQAPQSDQFGNANKMVEQPSTKQEGRREEVAPKPKNQTLDSLQAEYDKAKSALDAIGPEPYQPKKRGSNPTEEDAKAFDEAQKRYRSWRNKYLRLKKAEVDASNRLFYAKKAEQQQSETTAREEAQAEQSPSDRFRAEVERRKQEREGPQQAQEQPKQAALAPEDRSAYALDLAGYNEQTPAVKSFLDDAFDPFDEAAEGQSVEAAMRSLGFTEEEINAELQAGKGAQEAEEADTRGTQGRTGSADARQADQGQGQQEGLTAEQKIRQAFNNGTVTLGVAKPITVQHNGRTQQFMARQDKAVRNGRADSVIHLMMVRRGKLLSSLPEEWILEKYKLTSKNQLVEEGAPQSVSEQEAESFLANFRAAEPLTLDSYTNADIAQRESEQRTRDEAEQQAQRDAERRAQADAERGSFTMTGSDRPADMLAAQGQGGLFDAPQQPAKPTQQQIDAEAAKVPSGVQARVKISLRGLRDIHDRLKGVMRARGKGQILSIEVRDAQEEIAKRNRTLDDFRKMASEKGIDADLALRGMGGVPDFSVFGDPAPVEQSPSDRFRAEVERRKQERDKEFVHNGVRIYPATINVAGERKQMWGVESSENKAKREAGERYGFGDSLFDTKEQATAAADRQIQRDAERAEFERRKTEIEAEKQAEAAARKADTINGFLDGKAPNTQELIRKALNKQYRFDGVIRSVRQQVEWLNENGTLDVRTFEEPKIKPMSRTQFNRASQREQDAHEKKMREAGTKTVYLVSGSELGKYAYDYAQHLIARKTATPQQAQEQPKQAERVEQPSAPAAQEAQPEQAESFPVNPELESLFESLDGTSTRKANKAKKAIQSDPRADKINMVQDKFLDILQALEDSGAVKINCK